MFRVAFTGLLIKKAQYAPSSFQIAMSLDDRDSIIYITEMMLLTSHADSLDKPLTDRETICSEPYPCVKILRASSYMPILGT